jgi:pimeloyl-ACP methyl ester carboxylesterase
MPELIQPDEPPRVRVKRGLVRSRPRLCLIVYLVLLLASNITDWQMDEARIVWGNLYLDSKNASTYNVDTSGLPVNLNPLEYRVVVEGDPASSLPPVVLIHGSPGGAVGFDAMAPELTHGGRRVIYMDLPGFASQNEPWSRGSVFEDYGSDTYGAILWRLLESMGDEERVHIVGWSNGGAVGLRMIEQHPERVASMTLLAAVGAQENEGTGSYAFEHFKYKAGRLVIDHGSHLIPHFGILGPMGERNAFLRYFDDTDQRDLGALMESVDTPTMIMHGRHDFLIADRAAEDHYQRMRSARLVMLDAMHFIPFLHPQLAGEYLNPFFARHDVAGVEPETGVMDLAPVPARSGFDRWLHDFGDMIHRHVPWWGVLIVFTIFIRFRTNYWIVISTLLVAMMSIDFAVVLLAILIGRGWWVLRGSNALDRPWTILGWVRSFLFFIPAFGIGVAGAPITLALTHRLGLAGFVVGTGLTTLALILIRLGVTWEGRQRIKGCVQRLLKHEYYPSGVLYLTTLWAAFMRILSGKGLRSLTAVNPGYSDDGGLKEERKSELDTRFQDDPSILRCALVESNLEPAARAQGAAKLITNRTELGGFPIIAKPDQGARGTGVRLLRSHEDLVLYCADHPKPFVLQRYHPGPIEIGVLWVRHPEAIAEPLIPTGFIYAITKKDFPGVVGDGKRSLRQLILAHPRHRAQARIFVERLRDQQHLIPDEGEYVSLGSFGNHAQGAMFTDGEELITPELSARIDEIAAGFCDDQGRRFDIGRFDIRCTSYESLMRGEDLGIVELNGLTSEPTNMYDPNRSLPWAWRTMLGYWRHVETLSDARIAHGSGEPISKKEAWDQLNDFLRAMSR